MKFLELDEDTFYALFCSIQNKETNIAIIIANNNSIVVIILITLIIINIISKKDKNISF